jgi:hypothetical protein
VPAWWATAGPRSPSPWQEVAAFQEQDPPTGRRQDMGERAAACPRPDDDHVVVFGHASTMSGPPARRTLRAG